MNSRPSASAPVWRLNTQASHRAAPYIGKASNPLRRSIHGPGRGRRRSSAGVKLTSTNGAARPSPRAANTASAAAEGAASQEAYTPERLAALRAERRPVFVNFTADWCVTCKINEAGALHSARTSEAFQAANAVYLVGDWTRRDDRITAELERHGRSGVPLYLLYTPGDTEPRILPQLLTEGLVTEALEDAGR